MNNLSAGYNELPASIMKQCIGIYIDPLTFLINQSISQGVFPAEMQIDRVITIYKGKDNQRTVFTTISVLPFFSIYLKNCISIFNGFFYIIISCLISVWL